jgi:hypothetical protein
VLRQPSEVSPRKKEKEGKGGMVKWNSHEFFGFKSYLDLLVGTAIGTKSILADPPEFHP